MLFSAQISILHRTTFGEVKERFYTPYILGGSQRPECRNCHKDHLWAHFCQYDSGGPVCTAWDKWRILDTFLSRFLFPTVHTPSHRPMMHEDDQA